MTLATVSNVNRGREVRPSLLKAIRATVSGSWGGASVERDLSQATSELFGSVSDDSRHTVHIPSTLAAYGRVLAETGIKTPATAALRSLSEGASALTPSNPAGGLGGFTTLSDDYALALTSSIVLHGIPRVQIVPVKTRSGVLPAETVAATTAPVAENATQTSSDPTLAAIPYKLRKVSAFRTLSDELLGDLVDPGAWLHRQLSRDVALAADTAYLEGSGAGENPTGIRNASGLTTSSWVAAANGSTPAGDDLLAMVFDIFSANAVPTDIVMAPRTSLKLAGLKDASGRYVFPNLLDAPYWFVGEADTLPRPAGLIWGARVWLTTTVPINETRGSSNAASHIIYGDFRQLVVPVRSSVELRPATPEDAMQLRISPHPFFNLDQTAVLATLRTDLIIAQPKALAVATGLV